MEVKKVTLNVKDRNGVKFIEIDPTKNYFLVMDKKNGSEFMKIFNSNSTKELLQSLNTKYLFIVEDIKQIKLEEKEQFLEILKRRENEAKQ